MLREGDVESASGAALPLRGRRLAATAAIGTLAQTTQGVVGLSLILVGHAAGFAVSLSAAGVGAFMIGGAVGRPTQGRLLDRVSARAVLTACGLAHFGAYVAVAVAAAHGSTVGFLAGSAAAGVTLPPIATRQRASWPARVARERTIGVFALISSLQTVSLLIAPVLFTAVAVATSARAAMLVVAALSALGTVICGVLDDDRAKATHRHRIGVRRYVAPLIVTALLGVVAGSIEVAAPVLAIAAHHTSAAGPLVLAESLGTLIGALAAARLRFDLLTAGLAIQALCSALLMIPAPLVVVGVVLFVVGMGITPALSTLSMVVSQRSGGSAESFGWQSTALTLGTAAGSAGAGLLAHGVGTHASLSFAVGAAVLGVVLALRLTRRHAGGP